jgi:hypothetical protein
VILENILVSSECEVEHELWRGCLVLLIVLLFFETNDGLDDLEFIGKTHVDWETNATHIGTELGTGTVGGGDAHEEGLVERG